ncbi:hypothetical protein [Bdellovibrio reynosensis]|uniref:Major outer membrane protein n=1 Tax=Bdellovibrio reynosensis TaxID=2835041 RepID=A0ABY4C4Z7_9BACT|nr:hypothetical protein [Bdellovibrio reynosensis]UOF00022.1 hypothetical protein MNR06_09945 [Bdellovibrio reynosensis]
MKKLLVLAALTVAATPALASKARLTALGNAAHLIDTQTIFVNSADIHYLGDFATLEFGAANNAGAVPHAEGGFVRSSAMGKWGAYLGRQSATVSEFVKAVNDNALVGPDLLNEQNALDLMYGTELAGLKWGFGFHYSAAKDESDAAAGNRKIGTMGASAGVRTDIWDAYVRFGLMGKSENDLAPVAPELEQKGLIDLGGGYWMDSMYVYAKYLTTKGTLTAGGTDTDIEKNEYSIGAIDTVKVDGGSFFYGASYASSELKQGPATRTATGLPVLVGMELDATSWMVLRGSIKQTVLLGDVKDDANDGDTQLLNDTTVAAGAGLKFGKLTLDGTLAGSTTGDVNANTLLANASMTYMF